MRFMVEVFAIFAMLLITILNHCHRFPGFVYEWAKFSADKQAIEVRVRPRSGSAAVCSGCQKPSPGYDHLDERRFEFIPLWGFLVFFLYRMRRVNCRGCGVVVEEVPWGSGKHHLTKVYMQFLAHWARKLSWKEVAESFQTSWEKVCDSVEYVVQWGLQHRSLGPIFAIGVDELQYARGHKYLTLVYQIDDLTRLLWVGKERTVESFEGFFAMIGQKLSSQIEFVHEPLLKKTRWCLLKRKQNLTGDQRFRLRDLLRYNLKTVRAYLLKEDFQQFWEYESPAWAGKFLTEWCRQTMRSRIEPMKKVARMLRAHRDLILNYFKAKKLFSSGIIEGLNNKAKVTMRKSYGFRTFRVTELALYHTLGKLPEPDLTHRFY